MDLQNCKGARYLKYEPGNGTRYDIYFVLSVHSENVWIVSVPNFNVSFECATYATLSWDYVHEKFSRGREGEEGFNRCDASAITAAIAKVLDMPYVVHTDENGRWTEELRNSWATKTPLKLI